MGAAKTATTYIQHGLFNNTELLAEHGVYLPKAGRFQFSKKSVVHHNLGWELLGEQRYKAEAGGWEALTEELKSVDAETVIISSESLERMSYSSQRRSLLEDRLKGLSADVTVIYAVRDQLSSLNSLYTQSIKSFRTHQSFSHFVAHQLTSGHFDFNRCFNSWYESDVLKLVAVPFSALVAQDPLVGFLAAAGVDVPADRLVLKSVPSNVSPGPIAVEAAKLLGQYLLAVDPRFKTTSNRGRRLYRLAALRARENGWCEDKYWGWTHEEAERTAFELEDGNRRFAEAMWGPEVSLELPLDRPTAAARLLGLDPKTFKDVQIYVDQLVQRYLELRTGQTYLPTDSTLSGLSVKQLGDDEDIDA